MHDQFVLSAWVNKDRRGIKSDGDIDDDELLCELTLIFRKWNRNNRVWMNSKTQCVFIKSQQFEENSGIKLFSEFNTTQIIPLYE